LKTGLNLRLRRQLSFDVLRSLVEDPARRHGVASSFARIRDVEQSDEKVGDLLGCRRFNVGSIPFARRPSCLPRHGCGERREQDYERCGSRHSDAMSANELADPISRARWTRNDRQIFEMAAQIGGQVRHRTMTARAVFLEGAHRDPIEIAAQLAREQARLRRML